MTKTTDDREVKLTKQSQAVLVVLRKEMEKRVLTEEQVEMLTEALEWYDSAARLMVFGYSVGRLVMRLVITVAGFITAWYVLLGQLSPGGKP